MVGKSSLIFVIGFGIIMGYIILNLTSLGTSATENISWYNSATSSKNLAAIGANIGLAMLTEDDSVWVNNPVLTKQEIDSGPYSGGNFTVSVNPTNIMNVVVLESISEFPFKHRGFKITDGTIKDTVEVALRLLNEDDFQLYAWLTSFPGNDQFFFPGDTVWGPIHANGNFHLHHQGKQDGTVFHGKLTARGINPNPRTLNTKFLGGYETGIRDVEIPTHFDELKSAASSGGVFIGDEPDVSMSIDGNLLNIWYSPPPTEWDNPDSTVVLGNFNGAVYVDGNLHVKGQVTGGHKVSFGAENNIIVVGNILYSETPPYKRTLIEYNEQYGLDRYRMDGKEGVDELLGFVAGNDIILKYYPGNPSSKQLFLHGIYFALGKIQAEIVGAQDQGVLDVWGSVIQGEGRATIRSPNNPSYGFRQYYRFDTRLIDGTMRPPFFPGFYKPAGFEILSWYESVQIPPF